MDIDSVGNNAGYDVLWTSHILSDKKNNPIPAAFTFNVDVLDTTKIKVKLSIIRM
jgi:hypothetical protein